MDRYVFDLISSYERRLNELGSVVTSASRTAECCEDAISQSRELAAVLRNNLKNTLARNCSLRCRDFDRFMAGVFARIETRQRELERDRSDIKTRLADYIAGQKAAAAALREELAVLDSDLSSERLPGLLAGLKSAYRDEGEQTLARLRDFELRVEAFRLEQSLLREQLSRLLERADSVNMEDLKRLRAEVLCEPAAPAKKLVPAA